MKSTVRLDDSSVPRPRVGIKMFPAFSILTSFCNILYRMSLSRCMLGGMAMRRKVKNMAESDLEQ